MTIALTAVSRDPMEDRKIDAELRRLLSAL